MQYVHIYKTLHEHKLFKYEFLKLEDSRGVKSFQKAEILKFAALQLIHQSCSHHGKVVNESIRTYERVHLSTSSAT